MTKPMRELRHAAWAAARWTRRHLAVWLVAAGAADTALIALLAELLSRPGQSGNTATRLILVSLVPLVLSIAFPIAGYIVEERDRAAEHTGRRLDTAKRHEIEREVSGRRHGLPKVKQVSDRALLGIHPAIPLAADASRALSSDLPLYIPRDIDVDLRAWVKAHQESGGFLLLVGPAAAGKTRTAHQLITDTLGSWPLFMPVTATQLTSYVSTLTDSARLVIWLNEAQRFVGAGGATAGTIRRALACPAPVIIIGTIWPEIYDALTGQPRPAPGLVGADPLQDARDILTMLADRQDLPAEFSGSELARAWDLALRDPRIAQVLAQIGTRQVPRALAAAPELIRRWTGAADPLGTAVITAAVIARRCGHPNPVPEAVLKPLAEATFTPAERPVAHPGWFNGALDWARAPVRGNVAPLTPQGAVPGHIDGDYVSDVLVQHAARDPSAPGHVIPDETWLMLISHATPDACESIAHTASPTRDEHQAPITERAARKAADAGHNAAMILLGALKWEQKHADEAEYWWRKAADAGDPDAMLILGTLLDQGGQAADAAQWYRKSAEAGNRTAMNKLGSLMLNQGQPREAEHWWREAASVGDLNAMNNLGVLLRQQGQTGEGEQWYHKAADAGHVDAMSNLGRVLDGLGKAAEAQHWWRKAGEAGDIGSMALLAVSLEQDGSTDEAVEWLGKAAAASGDPIYLFGIGALLERHGRITDAEPWFRKAAEADAPVTKSNFGATLGEREAHRTDT